VITGKYYLVRIRMSRIKGFSGLILSFLCFFSIDFIAVDKVARTFAKTTT
jgi:hypothetical protein